MKEIKNLIWESVLFYRQKRKYLFAVLLSVSLLLVLLPISNLAASIHLSVNPIFYSIYLTLIYINSIIVLLFLPSFPLYFLVLKLNHTSNLEKCGYTFATNLSFYILTGYLGFLIGIPLNSFYFFFSVVIIYCTLISIFLLLIVRRKVNKENGESRDESNLISQSTFSMKSYVIEYFKTNLNSILLIIFLGLLGIVFLSVFSSFSGLDPWYHITLAKIIGTGKYLPLNDYFGALGAHIIGAIIHYFSGIDFILIPRYFWVYTLPLYSITLYFFIKKIFKNKNIAILGVFFIEGCSVILIGKFNEFWPTGLAFFQMLFIFYMLYSRAEKFLEKEYISLNDVSQNLPFYYVLVLLIFISSVFTHSLVSLILLLTYGWIYIIYFLRDFRRGLDFILIIGLGVILFILIILDLGVGHLGIIFNNIPGISNFNLLFLLGGAGGLLLAILIIRLFTKKIRFGKKTIEFELAKGENKKKVKIEYKIIFPIAILIFFLFNIALFSINPWIGVLLPHLLSISIFVFLPFIAIWGYLTFQKTSRGQFLFIWFIGFSIILGITCLVDVLFLHIFYFGRIFELIFLVFVLGFIAYWYKLIKMNLINSKGTKIFLFSIIIFSLITTMMLVNYFSDLKKREKALINQFSEYNSGKKVILTEFGFHHAFNYYEYPYGNLNVSIEAEHIHFYIYLNENNVLNPENHFTENYTNILKQLKKEYETDVYLLLLERFTTSILQRDISDEIIEEYYSLPYLDRICSSKAISGEDKPLYWVI